MQANPATPAADAPRPIAAPGTDDHGVFSCEVFDAVLTRVVGSPAGAFLLLGQHLANRGLLPCAPHAFSAARVDAEQRARLNGPGTPCLHDVYEELEFTLGLDSAQADQIRQAELAFDRRLIRPVPGAAERLARARAEGRRVAFVTDCALDAATVRALLEQHGMMRPGDTVHASCSSGRNKADGGVFREVARSHGVPLNRMLHRGSDPLGDVAAAARAGVQVEPFLQGSLNRYEQIHEAHAQSTDGLAAVMAGASRLARLSVTAPTARDAALRDVTAAVGAPALVSYVLWVLIRARSAGIRRLYFLARDGHVLMVIARELVDKLGFADIELRYLYGGRQAWYVPSITDVERPDLFWALDYAAPGDGVETFLRRIGIEAADVANHLDELGFARSDWSTPRPPGEQDRLWEIPRHPAIRTIILERAAQRREEVLGYFEQQGLLDDSSWALVDVGWSGRLLGAMNKILEARATSIPVAFFFARFVDREQHRFSAVNIVPFLADHTRKRGQRGRMKELFIELFCGADQGVALGYAADDDGRYSPTLSADSNAALTEWGMETVHETVRAFVRQLWIQADAAFLEADMRRPITETFRLFETRPTAAEAEAWGTYPFEYGRNGEVAATLATPLSLAQLPRILRMGSARTRSGTEWKEASFALTPPATRLVLHSAVRLRHVVSVAAGRLGSRLRSVRKRLTGR